MESLRLVNYRKFNDTGTIPLKPLTFLIGANSSGKSSFLKFFPLLKQTVERHPNGVFLWYSNDVDFKDFKNTVKDGTGAITIEFTLKEVENTLRKALVNPTITITIAQYGSNPDVIERLTISDKPNCYIDVQFPFGKHNSLIIDINGMTRQFEKDEFILFSAKSFIPQIWFRNEGGFGEAPRDSTELIESIFGSHDLSNSRNARFALRKALLSREYFIKQVDAEANVAAGKLIEEESTYQHYILYKLNAIFNDLNVYLSGLADRISYIQPLRANAQRFYRISNIAINEIDSHGDNLAMYLNSLSAANKKKLNLWLKKNFGIKLDIKSSDGHVELRIVEPQRNESRNLVDLGFGYSQLLPIIISIWNKVEKDNSKKLYFSYNFCADGSKIIVIEQPELHLHPNMVSKFAMLLSRCISAARGLNMGVKFIIETHSETLIKTIGRIIASSKDPLWEAPRLDASDVSINLFNAEAEGFQTEILQTGFDNDGNLKEWPYGFFAGDVY